MHFMLGSLHKQLIAKLQANQVDGIVIGTIIVKQLLLGGTSM